MRSSILALIFSTSLSLGTASTIPDSLYQITIYENGTQVFDPEDSSKKSLVVTDPKPAVQLESHGSSAREPALTRVAKRRIDCWGFQLDTSGVDRSFDWLAEVWAGNGNELCAPSNGQKAIGVVVEQMFAYYCLNGPNKCGNLDRNDVYYAKAQMDDKCRRYEASWFGWPGSFEIVGKATIGDSICQGGMVGRPF